MTKIFCKIDRCLSVNRSKIIKFIRELFLMISFCPKLLFTFRSTCADGTTNVKNGWSEKNQYLTQ